MDAAGSRPQSYTRRPAPAAVDRASWTQNAQAVPKLGPGHYQAAAQCLLGVYEDDGLCLGTQVLPGAARPLVEAAVRCCETRLAGAALIRAAGRLDPYTAGFGSTARPGLPNISCSEAIGLADRSRVRPNGMNGQAAPRPSVT